MQYSEQRHKQHSQYTVENYRENFNDNDRMLWDIHATGIDDMTVGLMGTLTAYIDEPNQRADMGILIRPMFAKMGYGLEAWKLAMGHVFTRVPRIFAGMMDTNQGMRRICEKSGMQPSGFIENYFQFNGQPENCIFYRRDR